MGTFSEAGASDEGGGSPLSSATPQPIGTAAAGTSTDASRADHVHGLGDAAPKDAEYWVGAASSGLSAEKSLAGFTGLVKNTAGTPSQAAAGTDYVAPFGPHQTYRELGLALLGISRANAWEIFENFAAMPSATAPPAAWSAFSSAGTGNVDNDVAGTPAISRMATGATASSSRDQATISYLGHQGTSKWYYAARFRVNASPDAQARMIQCVIAAGGNTVGVGVHGPVSDTNFVAFRDGTFSAGTSLGNLGAFDTSFHTFEMWCIGDSVLKARMDGGSIISGTQSAAAADMYLYHVVRNGTTAADRQMDRRFSYFLVEVP